MTKLKIDITFNSSCQLSATDITGFKSGSNTDGFILENATPSAEGDYKISNGYFINAIFYHQYIGSATLLDSNEPYEHITTGNVSPTYSNNFLTKNYTLKKDGVYSFKRVFIISKAFYLANIISITKDVIYYDPVEDDFVSVVDGVTTVINKKSAINAISAETTGSIIAYKFISTCYLNKCRYLLESAGLNRGLDYCGDDQYKAQRDYILMTINVIRYLKEAGHLTEVQKVIELSNCCGLICKEIGDANDNDCGCG